MIVCKEYIPPRKALLRPFAEDRADFANKGVIMNNLKKITLLLSGLVTLAACGGKQDSDAANTLEEGAVLAVRTFEDVDGTEQEGMTEVAILEGQFDTPEQAQLAAENAEWTDISQFELDDEIDFESVENSSAFLSEQDHRDRFGDDRRRGGDRDRDFRDRDRRRGDRDFRDRDRGRDRDRDHRRFRRRHHDRDGWRPNNYRHRWQRRPFTPARHRFYGFQRCTYRYIYRRGRCYRPVSRRWNYSWQHGWGYTTHHHRRNQTSRLRVRVRFFL